MQEESEQVTQSEAWEEKFMLEILDIKPITVDEIM